MQSATFAAGCFWGIEARFAALPGVISTAVGYMGGSTSQPEYRQVCSGDTGHAEVVQLTFDEQQTDYNQLLNAFWQMHDPTTLNRQGPDIGSQYRSAIFFHSPEQQTLAEISKAELNNSGLLATPVVTEITSCSTFWRAEEYHQRYLEKNGRGLCGQ